MLIQTDNSTTSGITNDTVKQKQSKAIDMRFYWIRDCVRKGQFHIFWQKGSLNKADYFTKHHPASHHQQVRSSYLHEPSDRSRNYFDCLRGSNIPRDSRAKHPPPGSAPLSDATDSGEGVYSIDIRISPGNPEPSFFHNP